MSLLVLEIWIYVLSIDQVMNVSPGPKSAQTDLRCVTVPSSICKLVTYKLNKVNISNNNKKSI